MTETLTKVTRTFTATKPLLNDRNRVDDGEDFDVFAFIQGIRFAASDPPAGFNLEAQTWQRLGRPQRVNVTIEVVE